MRFIGHACGLFILLSLVAAPVRAASFDCRKASAPDEMAICADPLLSELDEIMADFYRRLRHYTRTFDNAMGLQGQLKAAARAFLRKRAGCGANTSCLEAAYRARIRQLVDRWRTAMGDAARAGGAGGEPLALSCKALNLSKLAARHKDCEDAGQMAASVETWRLDGGKIACAVPCFAGAYNLFDFVYLVDARKGRVIRRLRFPEVDENGRMSSTDMIVSPRFNSRSRTITAFDRGRGLGDCGEKYRWRWNGKAFTLQEQRRKNSCDGKPGPWRRVWPR